MAKQHVIKTVRQILTAWTPSAGDKPAIVYPNGPEEPPEAPAPYLAVQFPVSNESRTSFDRSYVEDGAARIVILAERGGGTDWSMQLGEEIAKLFRSRKINGVEFLTPTSPILNDDNDEGNYFRTSIVAPYTYHFDDPE